MENRREMLSRGNCLFMQNKAYWETDSDRAYGRGENVLTVLPHRGQDLFSPAEDVPDFLLGSCFFREGPCFSVRLCFSADFAEAEKPVRWFCFPAERRSGVRRISAFRKRAIFLTEKYGFFLTGKG